MDLLKLSVFNPDDYPNTDLRGLSFMNTVFRDIDISKYQIEGALLFKCYPYFHNISCIQVDPIEDLEKKVAQTRKTIEEAIHFYRDMTHDNYTQYEMTEKKAEIDLFFEGVYAPDLSIDFLLESQDIKRAFLPNLRVKVLLQVTLYDSVLDNSDFKKSIFYHVSAGKCSFKKSNFEKAVFKGYLAAMLSDFEGSSFQNIEIHGDGIIFSDCNLIDTKFSVAKVLPKGKLIFNQCDILGLNFAENHKIEQYQLKVSFNKCRYDKDTKFPSWVTQEYLDEKENIRVD